MNDPAPGPPKSEKDRRRLAWKRANAGVRMEGGRLGDDVLAMQERHIEGDISMHDYRAWLEEKWAPEAE